MENKILVIGSSNTDMTVMAGKLPRPGETVIGGNFMMGHGGKGANQAVAARLLGGNVSFVCKIGRDMFGEKAVAHYADCGLDTSHILYSSSPSGVALITVDSAAENAIVVASGANADVTEEDIRSLRPVIAEADILLLQLEIPLPAVRLAARIAKEAGVTVVLNPAPAAELPEELLKDVSILIPNETEASALTGISIEDENTAAEAVKVLKGKGVGEVIITLGANGSVVYDGICRMIPARKVRAVDTTAAGDTFCAAVCVALSEGRDLVTAATFATAASSLAVQKSGAQDSIPTRQEVDALFAIKK